MDASAKIVFAPSIPSAATPFGTQPVHRNVRRTAMDVTHPGKEEVQGSRMDVHLWKPLAATDAHAKAAYAI